ncbi:MAG TPA: hypothetical protein PLS29_07990, partial [Acidimicrobiales bacterium]|nr:hypothetical protein [Acidimicrobiales bacterium]
MSLDTRPLETEGAHSSRQRLRALVGGDLGLVPVLIALVALVVYFQVRNAVFLSAANVTNLFIQAVIYVFLGMAEVWLL